jgi:ribosomal protein L20A (L18A)
MIPRRSLFTIAAIALFANVVSAQEKPNFSGTWKMNATKSDFGPMPAPSAATRTVTHADPELKFKATQMTDNGEQTSEATYKTDGSEFTVKRRNMEIKAVGKWEGSKLVVKSKFEAQGMEISSTENWMLAADGKELHIVTALGTPQGDFELKIVMEKQ